MSTGGRAPLQTFHALQASDLARACNDALKKVRIDPGDYAVEMTAPQGPSTAGGVQALQHLRLVPNAPGYPTLVFGHANHADGRAELRTYEHLDAMHRQRFKRPLTLDRVRYEECMALARTVLDALHLRTTLEGPPPEIESDASGLPQAGAQGRTWLALLVVTALLTMVGLFVWKSVHG